jgi:toxin ParE1/3/4
MAQVIWTDPALEDLNRIAEHISFRNPEAASRLVANVFRHVLQLNAHPKSGPVIPEFRKTTALYRHLVEPPCRIIYRVSGKRVWILHVMRGEMQLLKKRVTERFRDRDR